MGGFFDGEGFGTLTLRGEGQTLWNYSSLTERLIKSFGYEQSGPQLFRYNAQTRIGEFAKVNASGVASDVAQLLMSSIQGYALSRSEIQFPRDSLTPIRVLKVCAYNEVVDAYVEFVEIDQQSGNSVVIAQDNWSEPSIITGLAISSSGC